MSLQDLRVFKLSTELYDECQKLRIPYHLKSQLSRASSSIALNIAEGTGKRTHKDQRRFFYNAYGSTKETIAILTLAKITSPKLLDLADHTAASLYNLIHTKVPPLRTKQAVTPPSRTKCANPKISSPVKVILAVHSLVQIWVKQGEAIETHLSALIERRRSLNPKMS
ncbi:MAG: four helix bundle protein [Bacteriovoracaceae bacterium]|jgi:four helix bundle protein|nr:four helix bundle protein [Bacteriovoracaceae bacterium]